MQGPPAALETPGFPSSCRKAMVSRCVWGVWALCLLAATVTLDASEPPKRSAPVEGEAVGVWGHIYCDPALMPNLSISLNGMPLSSATLLPALPNRRPVGESQEGEGAPAGASIPAAEFRLPPLLPGAYLLEMLHPDLIFPKYRVVIKSSSSGEGAPYEVYRLNEYLVPSSTVPLPLPLTVAPQGVPRYFPVPGGFSIFDLLRQPLVILVLISLGIMYFLPKMQEAQLEEERQQLQQQQQDQHDQHVLGTPYSDSPESLFVEKLRRHGGF